MLSVCHVIPYLGSAQGGPVSALASLVSAQVEAGHAVSVVAAPRSEDGPMVPMDQKADLRLVANSFGGMFRFSFGWRGCLDGGGWRVVHSHGLWTFASRAADEAARRLGVPHVLAPCGMLQPGALHRSRARKQVCRALFQDRVLGRAACIHVKSLSERDSIRRLGLRNAVAVIPNPVPVPGGLDRMDPRVAREEFNIAPEARMVLYLGRLHPVKGLARLIASWAAAGLARGGWVLVLAGPDADEYRAELEQMARKMGVAGSVRFPGEVCGDRKWQMLKAADVFVMPSDFENFGTAVVEALAAGLPVIASRGTPWSTIVERRCGWYTDNTEEGIASALGQAAGLDAAARRRMGAFGRELAAEYGPAIVSKAFDRLYGWLCSGEECPPFVERV